MRGLGCEVAKNLVLAGVNSMTMLDHEDLTKEDFESQFLAPRDKLGTNRAEASLDRLQALNPGVVITVDKVSKPRLGFCLANNYFFDNAVSFFEITLPPFELFGPLDNK